MKKLLLLLLISASCKTIKQQPPTVVYKNLVPLPTNTPPHQVILEYRLIHCNMFYLDGKPVMGSDTWKSGEYRVYCE